MAADLLRVQTMKSPAKCVKKRFLEKGISFVLKTIYRFGRIQKIIYISALYVSSLAADIKAL